MKVYATIKDKVFDGYDIVIFNSYRGAYNKFNDNTIFIDPAFNKTFSDDIHTLLDNNFDVPVGSEIYMSPNCPVASNDIRKNYKIKRAFDSGICNVFSPLKHNYNYILPRKCAYYDTSKILFCTCGNTTFFANDISDYFKSINKPLDIRDLHVLDVPIKLYYSDKLNAYIKLLKGEHERPCVSYEKLKFENCNELTMDVLDLVYMAGSRNVEYDKFLLQLEVLNQCNWREYRRTITILLHMLMRSMRNRKLALNRLHSLPKSIKCILTTCVDRAQNEKDFNLAKALIIKYMGMEGVRFTDVNTLIKKLNEFEIERDAFSEFFDNMVRLTEKEYGGKGIDTVQ